MSESQTLKTMIHETAHSMLHKKEVDRDDLEAPVKDRNTKEVESIAQKVKPKRKQWRQRKDIF